MSEVEKLDIMNARWELMKEMMITGDQRISTSWAIKNLLMVPRMLRLFVVNIIFIPRLIK